MQIHSHEAGNGETKCEKVKCVQKPRTQKASEKRKQHPKISKCKEKAKFELKSEARNQIQKHTRQGTKKGCRGHMELDRQGTSRIELTNT